MDPEVRCYLAQIGRRGGTRSRRTLSPEQARAMVAAREAKRRRGVVVVRDAAIAAYADARTPIGGTTPAQRLVMLWSLARDVWAFAPASPSEPGLPRHPVVVQRRGR